MVLTAVSLKLVNLSWRHHQRVRKWRHGFYRRQSTRSVCGSIIRIKCDIIDMPAATLLALGVIEREKKIYTIIRILHDDSWLKSGKMNKFRDFKPLFIRKLSVVYDSKCAVSRALSGRKECRDLNEVGRKDILLWSNWKVNFKFKLPGIFETENFFFHKLVVLLVISVPNFTSKYSLVFELSFFLWGIKI